MAKKQEKTQTKPKKRSKPNRTPHVTRPTQAELLQIEERRCLVLDLSRTGLSIRQIHQQLKAKGYEKISRSTIHNDLNFALQDLANTRVQKTELLVEMELQKLDEWELSLNLELKTPRPSLDPLGDKINIFYALLKIQDRRDRFLTLSKREKSKTDARLALAKLMGVDPERLPNPNEK